MKVSVPPACGCSAAEPDCVAEFPFGAGVQAASRSTSAMGIAAIWRFNTRPPPRAETLAPLTNDFLIEFNELRRDVGRVVFRRAAGSGLAATLPQGGIAEQAFKRAGEGVGVLRLDQKAGDISLYDTLVAVDVARHDR